MTVVAAPCMTGVGERRWRGTEMTGNKRINEQGEREGREGAENEPDYEGSTANRSARRVISTSHTLVMMITRLAGWLFKGKPSCTGSDDGGLEVATTRAHRMWYPEKAGGKYGADSGSALVATRHQGTGKTDSEGVCRPRGTSVDWVTK